MSLTGESPKQASNPIEIRPAHHGKVKYLDNYPYGQETERAVPHTAAAPARRQVVPGR
jgi:hypothetical protein